jgi:L-alanine-DL-glutamate epimerase-like enolase superfamily enzyme
MSMISQLTVVQFEFLVPDIEINLGTHRAMGVSNVRYAPGGSLRVRRYAIKIRTDDGCEGQYVTQWVGTAAALGQTLMLAPHLIGRNPEHRELIYDDLKRELRHYDRMGYGPLDIALWDLVGKKYGMSIGTMLGAYRSRLPTYASTHHGQEDGRGLCSIEAFADYAIACKEHGFAAFKIHGWQDGNARREAANVLAVRAAVGGDYPLMLDPACQLRTYADALFVGRACDEAQYFWYEDPYRDGSVAAFGHKMLRDQLKTPILVSEHLRGLEQKANFVLAGGCDFIHVDPEFDMGITGAMKIAHFGEALGIDVAVHACGPAQRACAAAIRNTHYYELAVVGPGMPNIVPPVYTCGYADQVESVGKDGCVAVPTGPGLGVQYDWDYIMAHKEAVHEFSL